MLASRRPRPRGNSRPGLSLLEVILALAILVLAVAAINQLVDTGTDRGIDARAYTRGARLAQGKMAEVEAGVVGVSGETDGAFDGDDAGWTFKVLPEAAGPPNLYTVTVRVTRDIRGRPIEVSLTQMIFDPTMLGSTAQAERPAAEDTSAGGTTGGMSGSTGGTSP